MVVHEGGGGGAGVRPPPIRYGPIRSEISVASLYIRQRFIPQCLLAWDDIPYKMWGEMWDDAEAER